MVYVGVPCLGTGTVVACSNSVGCSSGTGSSVTFAASLGQIYRIQVGGFNGEFGVGTLTVTGPMCCRADFNGQGGLTVQDIFAFLTAWFAGNPSADFDGVNGLTVADIFAFLTAWFAGCP